MIFLSHGRKRAKKIAAGKLEVSEESLFDAFRVATTIHGRFYSESHAMLGQTYGVCVLQVTYCLVTLDDIRILWHIK
jgi:N-acetyltransferase 10